MGIRAFACPLQQPYSTTIAETFTFNGAWSSAPVADFLLGVMNQTTRTVGWNRNYLRSTSMGFSSMTISSSGRILTLNLGMRYEIDLIPADRYDRHHQFHSRLGKVVLAFDDPSVKSIVAAAA